MTQYVGAWEEMKSWFRVWEAYRDGHGEEVGERHRTLMMGVAGLWSLVNFTCGLQVSITFPKWRDLYLHYILTAPHFSHSEPSEQTATYRNPPPASPSDGTSPTMFAIRPQFSFVVTSLSATSRLQFAPFSNLAPINCCNFNPHQFLTLPPTVSQTILCIRVLDSWKRWKD